MRLAVLLPDATRDLGGTSRPGPGVGVHRHRRLPAVELPRARPGRVGLRRASRRRRVPGPRARGRARRHRPSRAVHLLGVGRRCAAGVAARSRPGSRLRQAEPLYLAQRPALVRPGAAAPRVAAARARRQRRRGAARERARLLRHRRPPAYVGALRDMAVAHGITVPLIACAGQGDTAGATGDVEGVVPALQLLPVGQLRRRSSPRSAGTPTCSPTAGSRSWSPRPTARTSRCAGCWSAAPVCSRPTCRRPGTTSASRRRRATGATPAAS